MSKQPGETVPTSHRWRYIVTPFCLLLLCLGTINVANWLGSRPSEVTAEVTTAVITPTAPLTATAITMIATTSMSTPAPIAISTPYTLPFYDNATIRLLGPPHGAALDAAAPVAFYWQWPLTVAEDEFFNLYVVAEEQPVLLGTIAEPNLGNLYYLAVDLQDNIALEASEWYWYVQLESHLTDQTLIMSEIRLFILTSYPSFAP